MVTSGLRLRRKFFPFYSEVKGMAVLFAKYLDLFDPVFCHKVVGSSDTLLFVLPNDCRAVSVHTFTIQAPSDVILSYSVCVILHFLRKWLSGPEVLSVIDTDNWISRSRISAQDI